MEFRCRLGTPGGEIIEGVYVADSEARLRREFEEKGLFVLGLHRAGRRASAASRCRGARGFRRASSWSSTRSSRRCSRRVCRSCSLWTSCAAAPRIRSSRRSRRCERAGTGGELAVRGLRGARDAFPRCLHRIAACRREERQPRAGDQALRLVREGCGQRQAADDFRARLSGRSCWRCRSSWCRSSCCGWFRPSARSTRSSVRSCRSRRGSSWRCRRLPRAYFLPILLAARAASRSASGSGCSGRVNGSGSIR